MDTEKRWTTDTEESETGTAADPATDAETAQEFAESAAPAQEPAQDPPQDPAERPRESEESMEALLAQQNRFSEMLMGRKPVWVKVIQVTKDNVLVDIGEKREGVVPIAEFAVTAPASAEQAPRPDGKVPAVGQRIPVILVNKVRQDGSTLLSYRRAKESLAWEAASKAFREKGRIRGTVTSSVKGGFMVDVGGVRAFLPSSLADLRPVRAPERMVGTGVRCYIIELNESKKQVVLSRRAVLEEDAARRRAQVLSELRVGEVRIGRVVHAGPAGLLVDIGGLEGFVKPCDVSWGTPKPPTDFARGSKLKVKVIGKPAEGSQERVALGIKQLTPNPADALRRKFAPKAVIRGKVTAIAPAGVTIRLEDGTAAFAPAGDCVEGLSYKEGEQVTGVVNGVDAEALRVSVSLRKYDDMKERKRMAQYLKAAPPLTLGELLSPPSDGAAGEAEDPSDKRSPGGDARGKKDS